MKRRVGFALLLLLVFVGTGMGQGQKQTASQNILRLAGNGVWWDSLSGDAKRTFVDGYTTAMSRVNYFAHSECMKTAKDAKPSGAEFNATFNAALNLCGIAEFFDFKVDTRKLADGIDEFYRDSRNTGIPIDFAIEYVRDEVMGKKSPKELEDELTRWREIMKK